MFFGDIRNFNTVTFDEFSVIFLDVLTILFYLKKMENGSEVFTDKIIWISGICVNNMTRKVESGYGSFCCGLLMNAGLMIEFFWVVILWCLQLATVVIKIITI